VKSGENFISTFYRLPASPVSCSHFAYENPKSYFSTVLFICTSDYLRYLRIKQIVTVTVQLNHNSLLTVTWAVLSIYSVRKFSDSTPVRSR